MGYEGRTTALSGDEIYQLFSQVRQNPFLPSVDLAQTDYYRVLMAYERKTAALSEDEIYQLLFQVSRNKFSFPW